MRTLFEKPCNLLNLKKLVAAMLLLPLAGAVQADGFHYKVDAETRFLGDEAGQLVALDMDWRYDAEVSAVLMEDEDMSAENRKETLERRAEEILDDLFDLGYFAELKVDGKDAELLEVDEFGMEQGSDGRLTLSFRVGLAEPQAVKGKTLALTLFDDTGSAALGYADASKVTMGDSLSSQCAAPTLSQATRALPGDHNPAVQTASIVCR